MTKRRQRQGQGQRGRGAKLQEWHEQEAGKARQARATPVLGASASELACPASRCQQCRIFSAKSKSGSRQSENKSERGRELGKVCKRDSESDAPSTASHVLLIFFSTWTPVAHASTLDHGECRRFVVSAAAGDDVAAVGQCCCCCCCS